MKMLRGLMLVLSLAACGGDAAEPAKETAPRAAASEAASPGAVTLEVVQVVEKALDVTLQMPGELHPYQTVALYPRVTGFVKTIAVDRGSRVRAGDPIAVLEAPELVAQRSEAESKLQAATAQLAAVRSKAGAEASTYEKLKAAAATPGVVAGNDLVVAQKGLEAAEEQVVAAQQNVEGARQALNSIREMEKYLRVTAPFDGVVTERNVHPGALVGPGGGPEAGMPMARLIDDRRLRLEVPVPEAYTSGVAPGTEISFSVSARPGQSFTGTVARIAQAVDVATRTMVVELEVDNQSGQLVPGSFCQVRWPVRRPGPSLLVPSRSVASTTDRTFVIRVRDGKTEWVDVRTGLGSGALVEVFGDLRPGDTVAARGTDEIAAGVEVEVEEAPPPT